MYLFSEDYSNINASICIDSIDSIIKNYKYFLIALNSNTVEIYDNEKLFLRSKIENHSFNIGSL